jgi:uncharacterized protein
MAEIERRFTHLVVEAREREKTRSIGGYAAVFDRISQNLGGFVEVVSPVAFNRSRGSGWPDVMARYNHDDNLLLGTTESGTLRLDIDDTGLRYEVDLPTEHPGPYLAEMVGRGDVRKSSFAFRLFGDGEDWGVSDQGFPLRTLTSVSLVDVAPVNLPAYVDTSTALRSLAARMNAPIDEIVKLAADNELRKLFVRTDGEPPRRTFGPAALLALRAKEESVTQPG